MCDDLLDLIDPVLDLFPALRVLPRYRASIARMGTLDRELMGALRERIGQGLAERTRAKLGQEVAERAGGKIEQGLAERARSNIGQEVEERDRDKIGQEVAERAGSKIGQGLAERSARNNVEQEVSERAKGQIGQEVSERARGKIGQEVSERARDKIGQEVAEGANAKEGNYEAVNGELTEQAKAKVNSCENNLKAYIKDHAWNEKRGRANVRDRDACENNEEINEDEPERKRSTVAQEGDEGEGGEASFVKLFAEKEGANCDLEELTFVARDLIVAGYKLN